MSVTFQRCRPSISSDPSGRPSPGLLVDLTLNIHDQFVAFHDRFRSALAAAADLDHDAIDKTCQSVGREK